MNDLKKMDLIEPLRDAAALLRDYKRNRNLPDQTSIAGQYESAFRALATLIDEIENE